MNANDTPKSVEKTVWLPELAILNARSGRY